jgi:hypothetical protein
LLRARAPPCSSRDDGPGGVRSFLSAGADGPSFWERLSGTAGVGGLGPLLRGQAPAPRCCPEASWASPCMGSRFPVSIRCEFRSAGPTSAVSPPRTLAGPLTSFFEAEHVGMWRRPRLHAHCSFGKGKMKLARQTETSEKKRF